MWENCILLILKQNDSVTSGDNILEISHREIQTKNHSSENMYLLSNMVSFGEVSKVTFQGKYFCMDGNHG